MGGNLFTHAMSEAEVQAHKVRLKVEDANKRTSAAKVEFERSLVASLCRDDSYVLFVK